MCEQVDLTLAVFIGFGLLVNGMALWLYGEALETSRRSIDLLARARRSLAEARAYRERWGARDEAPTP